MSNLDTTTPLITPAVRFAAAERAATLAYSGPHNLRVCIDTAAKVESFPDSYSGDEVTAATILLFLAGTECDDMGVLDYARRLFLKARGEDAPPACDRCGSTNVTVCVDYNRRDQGLPQPKVRRWVCGCGGGGSGVLA